MLLTLPTALLFAAGYLLRWRDIPRYWIWFGYINWCGPISGLSPHPIHLKTHARKLWCFVAVPGGLLAAAGLMYAGLK